MNEIGEQWVALIGVIIFYFCVLAFEAYTIGG